MYHCLRSPVSHLGVILCLLAPACSKEGAAPKQDSVAAPATALADDAGSPTPDAAPKQNTVVPSATALADDAGSSALSDDDKRIDASRAWLNLFKNRQAEKLAERTQFPFDYLSTNREKGCEGSIADADALRAFIKCTTDSQRDPVLDGLIKTLKRTDDPNDGTELGLHIVHREEVSWIASVLPNIPKNEKLVRAFLQSGGIEYDVVLMTTRVNASEVVTKLVLSIKLME